MDQIESDALYDERMDVSWARPLLQGDVFDGVVLPGFGDEPRKVQIVAHPCAMRTGLGLVPRITVAPVEPHRVVIGRAWDGSLRVMPLADLVGSEHFAAKFVEITAAPADLLTRARRIATLTHQGIYVLQQRLIKHYTRVEISLEVLRRQSAAVLTEAELQWDWLEEVLGDDELSQDDAIETEAAVFDTWLGERRGLLADEIHHTDLRREARGAARQRSQNRQGQG